MILSGPPGAGKTTVARRLARRFERAAHVEADRFFGFIESGFIDPWRPESHEQNAAVMQIVANTAAAYADAGYLTIVEGIVIPRWFLGPLRETLGHAGHGVAYAVLSAPLELCVARRPLIDPGVVESLWSQFADLGEFESSRLDVTDAAPEAIAAQLADGLHGHLLLSP